jgi:type II secretory ATPase GspE/PulE/Tfp pilus assembly ATPase PilB-like protein/FixJ family two-component response regulator/RNA polymerase subunit RPABC4/transcription elongation factor Spt4
MPEDSNDGSLPKHAEPFSLLFVDDEENVLSALKRVFLEENYEIHSALSPAEAMSVMERERVQLVISDHRMPGGVTGAQLLKRIKDQWPETIRIMLTGYADVQSIMGAVNEGAVYKFITKPWNDEDLRLTVSLALQQYALIRENVRLKEVARRQQEKIKNYSTLFDADRGIVGDILIKTGLITRQQLEEAKKQRQADENLIDAVVRLSFASETNIIKAVGSHQSIEYRDLREATIASGVVMFLPRELCEKNRLLPVKLDGKQITIAMADPTDIYKRDNISFMTGLKVVPLLARSSDILAQLKRAYGDGDPSSVADQITDLEPMDEIDIVIEEEEAETNIQELIDSTGVPPVIRIVNVVMSEALRYRASDIHIEPKTKYTVIRYRIDGMLQTKIKIPPEIHTAVVSRIKILGKLDIAERRKPQDGRITVKLGTRIVDIRVATVPTINGEKIVMRVLDKNAAIKKISDLGVAGDNLDRIQSVIRRPQGIIISTGPTGSGKTTMLYSILSEMMQSTRNFQTIEDPVEYFLEDANQIHIKDKIGVSFASILRATMRQDPDVILVGEIRDYETADIAFKAALTGHMVLTTLHTNSAVASITRLINMEIKPYLIASALEGILAQRLLRTVCRYCRTRVPADDSGLHAPMELLRIPKDALGDALYRGAGCTRCDNTGYLGRTGIFEVFVMTDDFRHLITTGYREPELLNMARLAGMRTLLEDGIDKVRRGVTTLEELLRVAGPQMRQERKCGKCLKVIDEKFLFCPYCGAFKTDVCRHCKMVIEKDWSVCPACGTERGGTNG